MPPRVAERPEALGLVAPDLLVVGCETSTAGAGARRFVAGGGRQCLEGLAIDGIRSREGPQRDVCSRGARGAGPSPQLLMTHGSSSAPSRPDTSPAGYPCTDAARASNVVSATPPRADPNSRPAEVLRARGQAVAQAEGLRIAPDATAIPTTPARSRPASASAGRSAPRARGARALGCQRGTGRGGLEPQVTPTACQTRAPVLPRWPSPARTSSTIPRS